MPGTPYDPTPRKTEPLGNVVARQATAIVRLHQEVGNLRTEVEFLTKFVTRRGFDDIEYQQSREAFDQRRMSVVAKVLDDLTPYNGDGSNAHE